MNRLQPQLGLVVAALLQGGDSQLLQRRADLLHDIWPDDVDVVVTLDPRRLENSDGQGDVVDAPARVEGGDEDRRFGHQISALKG